MTSNIRCRPLSGRIQLAIILVALAGCQDQGVSPPAWQKPYELWQFYRYQNYTIDQSRHCFCPNAGERMRIVIRSGAVVSVSRVSDGTSLSQQESSLYLTVDSMFSLIRSPGPDSLVVSYNSQYGYPESLDINPQLHPVDGGVLYLSSNLTSP